MKKLIPVVIAITFMACEFSEKKKDNSDIDYSNSSVLDSLIRTTPFSDDPLFLGFKMGMTRSEYKKHIGKLREDGLEITFSQSNIYTYMGGRYELGPNYTFKTVISAELYDKTITGLGEYFLEPIYNNKDELVKLNILPSERWNGDYFIKPNWLKDRIKESSKALADKKLKKALVDNNIINSTFIQQKDNLIIYEGIPTFTYVNLKTLLLELLAKEIEKEVVAEKTKNIQF
jgi:hypothetical protein